MIKKRGYEAASKSHGLMKERPFQLLSNIKWLRVSLVFLVNY